MNKRQVKKALSQNPQVLSGSLNKKVPARHSWGWYARHFYNPAHERSLGRFIQWGYKNYHNDIVTHRCYKANGRAAAAELAYTLGW